MSQRVEPSEFEQALARVFDRAWDAFLAAAGPEADTAENRGSLAARIVVIAKLGEQDEDVMVSAALLYLRALLAAKVLRSEERSAAISDATPGPVLDQESITAAAAAYDACIEELPEGISEYARSTLLNSVMDNAGKGIRDPARLRELALEKLRLRK